MSTQKAESIQRMRMINRVGCIAIVLGILLVVIVGIAFTYSGLQGKRKAVETEMATLKDKLAGGLDAPRPMGRFTSDQAGFSAIMAGIDALKGRIDSATTLPELDEIFDEFKSKSMQIRFMVVPVMPDDQSVRNTEANIDGVYNRWSVQREIVVKAINKYNASLASFPENIIGGMFGFREIPLTAPESEGE